MADRQLAVVKFGSESTTNSFGVDTVKINNHAQQLAKLPLDIIVVASGAVRAGEIRWRNRYGDRPVSRESLATLGTSSLMTAFEDAFEHHDRLAGQMLVTHPEIKDRREGPRFKRTLEENLESGIVTILNENDAVNDEEMVRYSLGGDNDELAYEVARTMGADVLALMTNVPGLLNHGGQVVRQVQYCEPDHARAIRYAGKVNELGQGMPTKVGAAIAAANIGIEAYIAHSSQSLDAVIAGEYGTHFVARDLSM